MAEELVAVIEDEELLAHIQTWYDLQLQLSTVKDRELEWRNFVLQRVFGEVGEDKTSGAKKLPGAWKLEFKRQIKTTVDKEALPAVLTAIRKLKVNPDLFIDWDPKLKLAALKEQPEKVQELMAEVLTRKPGQPQLSLVAPS
jgi:hypothetical protein